MNFCAIIVCPEIKAVEMEAKVGKIYKCVKFYNCQMDNEEKRRLFVSLKLNFGAIMKGQKSMCP